MENIIVISDVVQQIYGFGEKVTGISLGILLDSSIKIQPKSEIIVSMDIEFSTMANPISIVQKLSNTDIITSNNTNILMLQGMLWITGSENEISIMNSNVNIYYSSNN